METALVIVALIAFVAFHQWLNHHRRIMIHRERMAAIEKGMDLPPLEQEVRRRGWNVQRILLLAGLVWIALGVSFFSTLEALLVNGNPNVLPGIQYLGVAPVAIGVAHLVTYAMGSRREPS